jgi:purine-nucleoside phosphorylase
MASELLDQIREAAASVKSRARVVPEVGIILGTGLGDIAGALQTEVVIPYQDIPHFPHSTVESHAGELHIGTLAGL